MGIEHKWYMCGQDSVYIYESPDGGETIYKRELDEACCGNQILQNRSYHGPGNWGYYIRFY